MTPPTTFWHRELERLRRKIKRAKADLPNHEPEMRAFWQEMIDMDIQTCEAIIERMKEKTA